MLSAVLLQHSYLYVFHYIIVHAQKQIYHWFFWRKSAQGAGSFENGNSVQKQEMEPKQWYLFHWKYSQNQQNAAQVLQCEYFLKAPL